MEQFGNNQKISADEQLTNEALQQKQYEENCQLFDMLHNWSVEESNFANNNNDAENGKNVHDKLMNNSEDAKNDDQFRVEIAAVKTETSVLTAKVDSLQALNGQLQAKLELLEQKLEIAELKTELANEQMAKALEAKMTELIAGQLSAAGMAGLGGKIEEFTVRLANLETEKSNNFASLWATNRWDVISALFVRISSDGLVVTKTAEGESKSFVSYFRAEKSVSREMLASLPAGLHLVYFEVLVVKRESDFFIGWIDSDIEPKEGAIGHGYPGSYGLQHDGTCWESGRKVAEYDEFVSGDVVGSGVLLSQDGRHKLFFVTKNGKLSGKPIPLTNHNQALFPAVAMSSVYDSVRTNFGAANGEPFKFDLDAHKAQLFG